MSKTIAALKSDLTLIAIESRQIGAKAVMSPADKKRVDELHKEYNSVKDEITAQEIRSQRPPRAAINQSTLSEAQNEKEISAFREYIQFGEVSQESRNYLKVVQEKRSLSNNSPSTNPTSGAGVLIPIGMDDQINYAVKAYGEVASAVRTYTTDTGEGLRLSDADPTAQFMSVAIPGTPITPQDTPLDGRTVYTDYLAVATTVNNDVLTDSNFSIEDFVANTFGQIYGQTLAKFIMQGNSSNFDSLTSAAVSAATTTGTTISYNNLVDVYAALDPAHENGATWLCSKSVWSQLLKIVDGEGRPVLQNTSFVPGGGGPRFASLFGLPITLSQFSDPLTTGHKPLILTNAKKAYENRRVGGGLAIQRLNEVGALSLQTTFLATIRGGGYQRVLASSPTAVALTIGS